MTLFKRGKYYPYNDLVQQKISRSASYTMRILHFLNWKSELVEGPSS